MSIPVKNVYYMLSYAFKVLREKGYKSVETEDYDNMGELCAEILIRGFSTQIKRGVQREYIRFTEALKSPRGKIEITESIKTRSELKKQLVCTYDEFSVNSYMNRIIKTTMNYLLGANISKVRKKAMRRLMVYLNEVETLDWRRINWNLQYNRTNQTYQLMIAVCELVIKGLLQTTEDGHTRVMDFLDEQRMSALYEKFILEYYKYHHRELHPDSLYIDWNVEKKDDMLPSMHTDITLRSGEKTLIIDAKYYGTSLQTRTDISRQTLRSAHLYQVYAYVKNYDVNHTGNVSGLLLYAKTNEERYPNNDYLMDKNRIGARALDLSLSWGEIVKQLEELVEEYFPKVA